MSVARFTSPEVEAYDAACMALRDFYVAGGQCETGIAYGPDAAHRLDVYRPAGAGTGPLPVVLAFHGGGFTQGDQSWNAAFAPTLLAAPAILVAATYRRMQALDDRAPFEDGQRALAWVRAHITDHGGDPARIFLAGHSAGGALATTVALDAPGVAGVIAISTSFNRFAMTGTPGGGYDLPEGALPLTADAPLARLETVAAVPPFFIAWGEKEKQRARVERSSLAFAGRLAERGAPVTVAIDPAADHFGTHLAFADPDHRWSALLAAWIADCPA